MTRRTGRDERGSVLPFTAIVMFVVLIIAAIVVDLGSTRAVRRDTRTTADAAAAAGAVDIAASTASAACSAAFGYAFRNLRVTMPSDATITGACNGAAMNTACASTRREAVLSVGTTIVRVVNPVPDTDALMRGSVVGGGGSQTLSVTADGVACQRVGVEITRPQSRFFAGVVTPSAQTFTVHAIARYNPTPGTGGITPALVALNKTACNTIDAGNNGKISVRSLSNRPALAYSDSDGSSCPNASDTILVSYSSGNLRSIQSGGEPGELAWYSAAPSRGYRQTSSTKEFGTYDPTGSNHFPDNENYVGRLYARAARTTRVYTDQVYRCLNVPIATQATCPVANDPMTPALGLLTAASAPGGYATYPGALQSCAPPAAFFLPAGNYFVNCPTFKVKGGVVTYGGGNLIFNGSLSIESGGLFLVNTPTIAFNAGVLPAPVLSATQSLLVVKNGVSITSNGLASMAQTTVVNGAGLSLGGGATLMWSPPTNPPLTTAGSRKGLMYWSEASSTVDLQGGPNISAAGVFFAGNATMTAAGNGDIDLTKVQVWVDRVQISTGGPSLTMAADPDNSVGLDRPGTSLIR
jgi:hypothetical protein